VKKKKRSEMRKFGVLFGIRMSIFIYKKKNYRKGKKKQNKNKKLQPLFIY